MDAAARRAWRLPALVVGAGALLALLSIALALWSKAVLKDGQRAACARRASEVVVEVRSTLEARAREAAASATPTRPTEALAVWRLGRDGAVLARAPAGAAEPPAALVAVATSGGGGGGGGAGPRPVWLDGSEPLAATWVAGSDGASGVLVNWDLAAVAARVVEPALLRGSADFEAALVRDGPAQEGEEAGLSFRPRAFLALDPPFAAWRVAVGQSDPDAVRRALWLQTLLLSLLAAWLLVLLVGAVVAWVRRERAASARQEERERLLARAYHELQTPLALLRAAAESVQNGALSTPDELARAAAIVGRDTERVTLAVRRLLRWLRRDLAGADRSSPAAEVVDSAARELGPTLAARGVTLELAIDAAAGARPVPAELVGDVVRELLGNVQKHAIGATKARIELAPAARGRLAVRISDDGQAAQTGPAQFHAAEGGGLGLLLLREGLALAGGRLDLDGQGLARPDGARGVRASVELP